VAYTLTALQPSMAKSFTILSSTHDRPINVTSAAIGCTRSASQHELHLGGTGSWCSASRRRLFSESYSQLFWLTPSTTCALLSGLGRLGWRPPLEWADRLFLETYTHLDDYKPAELAGVWCWAA
jgi:hypothetical protein